MILSFRSVVPSVSASSRPSGANRSTGPASSLRRPDPLAQRRLVTHGSMPPILRHFAPSMEECSGLRVSTCKDSRRAGFEQFEPVALVDNTQLIVFSARQKRQIRHISRIEAHWVHGNEPELASVWYCFQQ
jgi:hypothetical protein